MSGRKRLFVMLICLLLTAAGAAAVYSLDAGGGDEAAIPETPESAFSQIAESGSEIPSTEIPSFSAPEQTYHDTAETSSVPDVTETAPAEETVPDITDVLPSETPVETETAPRRETILGYETTPIVPGVINEDSLESKDDRIVYTFTLDTSAGVRTLVKHSAKDSAGYLWYLYLYEVYKAAGDTGETSYRFLSKQSVAQNADSDLSALTGLYPGSYVIVVTCGTVFSDEYFDLTLQADTEGYYEQEPNDNIYAYNEIITDRPVTGVSSNIGLTDEDWFMFTLTETTVVNIEFAHEVKELTTVAWLLELTDADGNSYYYDRSIVADEVNSSGEISLPAGNYFYSVKANISNYTEYTVTVKTKSAEGYETEFNDAPETACPLVFDKWSASVKGSVSDRIGATDKDWFCFEIPSSGIVSVSLQHDDYERSRDAWTVQLFNDRLEAVWSQTSALNETTVVSPYIGLDAGRYYLRVDADNLMINNGTYTLGVQYSALEDWESERNNDFYSADELPIGTQISGCIVTTGLDFDSDCYAFTVDEKTGIVVSFSHTAIDGSQQGWLIEVFNEEGEKLTGFESLWHDANNRSEVLSLDPGKYFVKVSSGLHFSPRRYMLEIIRSQG